MKKGDKKTNKAIEFLYKLSMRDDFSQDIKNARKLLGIPSNGFKNFDSEDRKKWIEKVNHKKLLGIELSIREKYTIPLSYHSVLQEFIEIGKTETKRRQDEFVAFIDPIAHIKGAGCTEDYYREVREPFVKLIILGNNSKTDVLNFIDKNWKKIEEIFLEQGHKIGKRVRKVQNKDRDILVIKLSKKPIKELRKKLEQKGGEVLKSYLKEDIISKLLSLQKPRSFKVSSGYIRKTIQKYRNRKT